MGSLLNEFVKIMIQLVLLGIVGGGVSFLYSKQQKNREIKVSVLQRISELHGRFLSLRYAYNSVFINWRDSGNISKRRLTEDEIKKHKWTSYMTACQLIGEFQSISPLVSVLFPDNGKDIRELYEIYQEWRRQSGADMPILQQENGKSDERFKLLREKYSTLIESIKRQI